MSTSTTVAIVLVLAGIAMVVAGKALGSRRGTRPTGARSAAISVGCLFIGGAVATLLFEIADRD